MLGQLRSGISAGGGNNFRARSSLGILVARVIATFLIVSMGVTSSAQQVPVLSKRASAAKRTADKLVVNAPISVIRTQGTEQYGKFQSGNEEGFIFYDVDLNANVTLRYEEVRKIKNGYGGSNSLRHRHTDRTKTIIIVVAVLGALGGIIAAAASAKN